MKIILIFVFIALAGAQLRSKAKRIYVGSAINTGPLAKDAEYKKTAAENFNALTAEWEMKWEPIEGTARGHNDFTLGDQIVNFAHQNDMKVRAHALVWHQAVPKWVEALANNKTELEKAMVSHIQNVATHFKGKVYCWDVVNEVVGDDAKMRDSIFYKNFGTKFINQAFNLAHSIDPNAKLYINEYGTEGKNAKSDALYNLVKQLKSEGVPVQGVGFQAHFESGQIPADMQSNMQRFADLGVDVAVTELDIRVKIPTTPAELEQQAKDYAKVFSACEGVSRCVGVTVWGFSDKYSWVPDFFKGYGASNLFDNNFKAKPAVSAVEKILQ